MLGSCRGSAEIVAPEKPIEGPPGLAPPEVIAGGAEGRQTGGNHRLRLDRLLVEIRACAVLFMEAIAADRAEMSGLGFLVIRPASAGFESDLKRPRVRNPLAAEDRAPG